MPKNLKNIITAKFKRTFIDGLQHTWLFDDAPEAVKGYFKQAFGIEIALNIIIACYFSNEHWFVVTPDALVIEINGIRQTFLFKDITKVDCDFSKLTANKNKPFDVIDIYTSNGIIPLDMEKKTWGPWVEVLKLFLNKK